MKKIVLTLIVLFLTNAAVSAQLKKFKWETELCTFEGTYDARQHTAVELYNTYRMWLSPDFDLDTFDATAFKIEDIAKLKSVASLEDDYKRKSDVLSSLEIVKTPFWTRIKQSKLKALARELELARASVMAYQNPEALKSVTYADACVQRFAPPLIAGGDQFLNLWREINLESRRKNSDPERVRRDFEAQLASADRFKYAQVEVLTFGWWNCVNEFLDRGDDYEVMAKNYRKLFTKVREINCDEP